jgi:hypothetical protein
LIVDNDEAVCAFARSIQDATPYIPASVSLKSIGFATNLCLTLDFSKASS